VDASDNEFRARYGPWALIAGASEGLGAEFGRQLAQKGLNLVLVARRADALGEVARALAKDHGVEVRDIPFDLASPALGTALREKTADLEVGLLVYNAAFGLIGPFLEQRIEDKLRVIDINCRGPLVLAHEFGGAMVERGRGGILLMSSLAGFQGSPGLATYAASKAYDTVLGEGLWGEFRHHGVDVLSFCAGATRTPNFERSQPRVSSNPMAQVMEVEPVVSEALSSLGVVPSAVAGRRNRLASALMRRIFSRRLAVETIARSTASMYSKK
jgi:hypothetical protein